MNHPDYGSAAADAMQPPPAPYSQGLRQLADFLDRHPEYAGWFEHSFTVSGINLHLRAREPDVAAAIERFKQDIRAFGGTVREQGPPYDDEYSFIELHARLGDVTLRPLVEPADVCERVQVGTEEITETVPDPDYVEPPSDVPMVQVTREVPVYEWVCRDEEASA